MFKANRLVDGAYAEPYAGGAGAGLFLLFRGFATTLHLNDVDSGVVAFWRAVLNHNEKFARQIEKIPLSVREWDRQRTVYKADRWGFDLGFAFFYLNRTNRSGIMNGGIIGGRKQKGDWKMDARFNRDARRVRRMTSKWIMTYDDCPEIRALYKGCRIIQSELSYSAREVRRGTEIVIVGDGIRVPGEIERSRSKGHPGFELRP